MKKILLALALAAWPSLGLAQQAVFTPATMASVSIAGTVATATALVSGIAGKSIYVTSVNLVPLATSVVTFTSGTGATCTSPTNLTGALTFAAGQTYSLGSGYGAVLVVPQGQSLCITIATAVAPGSLAYSQF